MNNKKSYISSILKNIKSNYLRMIIGAILSFVASVVFTRGLGPEKYGIYTYMTWFTGTMVSLCGFGLEGTITKFLPEYYFNNNEDESRLLLKNIIKIQIIVVGGISLILLVTIPLWKGILKVESSSIYILLVLSIINILPTMVVSMFASAVQALQRFDLFAKVSIKTQIITFILNLIVILFFKKVEYMLTVLLISTIYQVIIYYKDIQTAIKLNIKDLFKSKKMLKHKKRITKYAAYMYINIVWQQIVWTRSEFLFLGIYCGAKEVGMYGLAYSLVSMIGMVFTPFNNVLNNYISELVSKDKKQIINELISESTKYFTSVLVLLFIYIVTFFNNVIVIIYSTKYVEVTKVFLILLASLIISQIPSLSGSLPFYYEKQRFIIHMGIVSGILNIILDIILIPKMGSVGAAIANSITQIICSIIGYLYSFRMFKIKFPKKEIMIILLLNFLIYIFIRSIPLRIIFKFFIAIPLTLIYIIVLEKLKIINLKLGGVLNKK